MFEQEEKELLQSKSTYESITIPENIDDFILEGMNKAKKKKRKRYTATWSSLAACLLVVLLLTSIRISPAFAAYVSQIPGLETLVSLVQGDKGLESAVKHEFVQPVGISDEHDGITFTVDHLIVDEGRMVVFYTIKKQGGAQEVTLNDIKLTDVNGHELEATYTTYSPSDSEVSQYSNTIDVMLQENVILPDTLKLSTTMSKNVEAGTEHLSNLKPVWNVTFPIDKKKFEGMREVYDVNQKVMVEGQSIVVKKATMYPTKIALEVEYDPKNTKRIFQFDDLRMLNEKGEEFPWFSASNLSKDRIVFYFQSDYFSKPKELFVKASSIRALDKDKLDVIVNLKEKKLEKVPDHRLRLKNIATSKTSAGLSFLLETDELDKQRSYFPFSSEYRDLSGKTYSNGGQFTSSSNENEKHIGMQIYGENARKLPDVIILQITDYPTRIKGDINIKVK